MTIEELRKLITERAAKLKAMRELWKKENRAGTEDEMIEANKYMDEIEEAEEQVRTLERVTDMDTRLSKPADGNAGTRPDPNGNITIEDQPIYRGTPAAALGQQAADVATMTTRTGDVEGAKDRLEKNTKRAMALIEKRQGQPPSEEFKERSFGPLYNPEARAAGTGQIQGIGSEGGFLLQSETSMDLMTHGFNNSAILRRCQRRTLTGSESLEVVGIDETSRADGSRGGGVRVYTNAELDQLTSSMTKFEKIKLAPEKLTGLYYASNKILMNAVFLGQEMRQLFSEEFAFKTQDLVMEGTGAGQALGIKNADCKISIAKETGQDADTILTENILKMYARFYLRAGDASVCWVANRNTFTQLFTLSHAIGTGGEMAKLFQAARMPGGTASMLGFPVEFVEQAEALGDAGDIWLCDFSQYLCVDYGDVNEASSIHFKFDYDQTTFRFVYHFDGQPRLVSAITPFKGSGSTVSPFVRIAERA